MKNLNREVADGHAAEQLLENPIYREALDKVKTGLIQAMADSPMGDEKTHNRLVIALQLLNQIERNIKTVAETGKIARIQINQSLPQKLRAVAGL